MFVFHLVLSVLVACSELQFSIHSFILFFQFVRTFTQVSMQWQDTDSMREELDDLQVCDCGSLSVSIFRQWMHVIYYYLSLE